MRRWRWPRPRSVWIRWESLQYKLLDGDEGNQDLANYLNLNSKAKATLVGNTVADTTIINDMADEMTLNINIDDKSDSGQLIVIKKASLGFSNVAEDDPANRVKLATAIKNAVNEHFFRIEAFSGFNCEYNPSAPESLEGTFKLTSGSSSSRTSSIVIDAADPATVFPTKVALA